MFEKEENAYQPGHSIGNYIIVEQIGKGGMGTVYLALDTKLDRRVAIKFLASKYDGNDASVERFTREAKAASGLNHPNILTIHEIGEFEGSHYIVSEFVEGRTLRDIVGERRLELSEKIDIAIQIASALAAAHKARIIHRDIKPENIIVRSDDYVKVVDFGLAKLMPLKPSFIGLEDETIRQNRTAKGLILGTVSYMSPEQARGETIDARTDIFSVGVVMYEIIAGRTPFAGDSSADTLANLINKEAPPLSFYVPGVPDQLQKIVSRALSKERDERYQTAQEFVADLKELKEQILSGERPSRVAAPQGERVTEVLHGTTGSTDRQTDKAKQLGTRNGIFADRYLVLFGSLAVLLVAAIAFSIYWKNGASSASPQIRSLAVLPLKSLDSGENYLGLGIADTVIRKISQTGQVTVRPTSAVRRYLTEDTDAVEAAKQLNTDAVLEGSVQRADDRLRVSVNLLRTSDGSSIWSDSFDMRSGDIFAIQDAVAQQVTSRLRLQLDADQNARLNKHATANPVAYDYYLRGIYSFDQRTWGPKAKPQAEATADLFKNAIAADPDFALAHAQLADVYAWIAILNDPENPSWFDRAQEEIRHANTLDPNLAETHIARMRLLTGSRSGYQWEAGIREILIAQQIDPNLGHADLADAYYHIGLEELADHEYSRAIEIDPTSQWTQTEYILYLNNYRRYDDLESAIKKYFPDDPLFSDYFLGKGALDKAAELIDQEIETYPDNPWTYAEKAIIFGKKGDHVGADASIRDAIKLLRPLELTYHHMTYQIACAYAVRGKKDEAMKWLRETAATGYPVYPVFERDSFLDPIRKQPEFIQFMTEMKSLNEKYTSEFQ